MCVCVWPYLWPSSCATVKANGSPVSSLMLQLRCGWHIPATWDRPRVSQGMLTAAQISFLGKAEVDSQWRASKRGKWQRVRKQRRRRRRRRSWGREFWVTVEQQKSDTLQTMCLKNPGAFVINIGVFFSSFLDSICPSVIRSHEDVCLSVRSLSLCCHSSAWKNVQPCEKPYWWVCCRTWTCPDRWSSIQMINRKRMSHYRVSRTATSWWSGWSSPFMLSFFCHLQKLFRLLSAWWLIFSSSCSPQSHTNMHR